MIRSLALGYVQSPYWLLFTSFVGLITLFQSALTRFCLMEHTLERLGIARRGGNLARA